MERSAHAAVTARRYSQGQMMEADPALTALARECVVQVGGEDIAFLGSGFFVTETDVLTCAHVVRDRAVETLRVQCGDGSVLTVLAAELRPPDGESFDSWPAPDLARLTVAPAPGRPTVWLGTDPLAPGTETLAFGRSSETPAAGVATHTLALRVVGDSAPPLLKVNADYVPPGMSGSAALDLDRLIGGNDRPLVDREPVPIEPIAAGRTAAVSSLRSALTDLRRHLGLTGEAPPLPAGGARCRWTGSPRRCWTR
jgi:hypothetical protein